jgi:bile acid-coenzyme A ligase
MAEDGIISYGKRLAQLADAHPGRDAVIFVAQDGSETRLTWLELERYTNRLARLLMQRGLRAGQMLVIGLPNSIEHIALAFAGWKAGALVLPLRAAMPEWERDRVLEVGSPALVAADWKNVAFPSISRETLASHHQFDDQLLPDCIPQPGRAIASGGSTGRPKIIVDPRSWGMRPGENYFGFSSGYRPGQVQLIAGPLYHNSPFGWMHTGIFDDQQIVIMERFDAAHVVDLIERYRVNFMFLSPTMMGRIARLDGITTRDFSSVEAIYHTSAPCPVWLKQLWIDLVGAEKIYEGYGCTEGIGAARIRGDEWLLHQGSVGRPHNTLLRILDKDHHPVPPYVTGDIYMRRPHDQPTYRYLGSDPLPTTADGYASVGDLGWLDADGFLFIADRRTDLVVTGGANVYPSEVEAVLSEHPAVADVVVIGIPHLDWGRSVHAIIEPTDWDMPPDVTELDLYIRARLSSYKIPKSYEFLKALPRNQMGKIRRSDLVAARERAEEGAFLYQRVKHL